MASHFPLLLSQSPGSQGPAFGINFLQFKTDHDSQHHTRESRTINPEWTNANGFFLTSTSPFTHQLPFNGARPSPAKLKGNLTFQSISYKLFQVSVAEKQTKGFCMFLAQTLEMKWESLVQFYRAAYERITPWPDFCDLPEESVSCWMLHLVLLLRAHHVSAR